MDRETMTIEAWMNSSCDAGLPLSHVAKNPLGIGFGAMKLEPHHHRRTT